MKSQDRLREYLRALPKAELHCHLDGSLRASTLNALAAERGVTLPVAGDVELANWMRVDDARNLEDYLSRFAVTLSVMQDRDALERVTYELVVDAAADGVRYIEIRFCPSLSTAQGLSVDEVMNAIVAGAERGEKESGTVARLIVCALRSLPVSDAIQMAELAVAFKGRVVAFDLAGGERGNPASRFVEPFAVARNGDLAVTVHAGEAVGAQSIREAVHLCGANRIGHGTNLFDDQSLMNYIADRGIPLEVCPTSNVQTRAVSSLDAHPLRALMYCGVRININTDNRLMSGVSLTDEYMRCSQHLAINVETLTYLAMDSFRAAFLPVEERLALERVHLIEAKRLLAEFTKGAS